MRLIYKHEHEGVWFSRNGHKAYLAGEKPHFMWEDKEGLVPTVRHHVARKLGNGEHSYTRELIMFYRKEGVEPPPRVPHEETREYWEAMFREQVQRKKEMRTLLIGKLPTRSEVRAIEACLQALRGDEERARNVAAVRSWLERLAKWRRGDEKRAPAPGKEGLDPAVAGPPDVE